MKSSAGIPIRCATAAVACLLMASCVLPDQLSQLQKDVADIKTEMRKLQSDQEQAIARLESVQNESRGSGEEPVTRRELADSTQQVQQVADRLSRTDERMTDLNRRLDRFSQELEQTKALARRSGGPAIPPSPFDVSSDPTEADPVDVIPVAGNSGSARTIPDPEALFNTSYTDFNRGNYALAVSGFEEYAQRFPESDLADNALYWIGECRYSQGDFRGAVDAFDRLLARYSASDKAAAANLKKAFAYREQNQIAQAITQLDYVVSTYPNSDEAHHARNQLSALGQ